MPEATAPVKPSDAEVRATLVAGLSTIICLSDRSFHTMSRDELESALRAIGNVGRRLEPLLWA